MPGYWMHETSGVLRPAIEAYLVTQGPLSPEHVAAIRAYLRQWIESPDWFAGNAAETRILAGLRFMVDGLVDRNTIDIWLMQALALNIDPL